MTTVVMTVEAVACSAIDTLLVLLKHQRGCQQCHFNDEYCESAQIYQKAFMDDVRRYVRAKG